MNNKTTYRQLDSEQALALEKLVDATSVGEVLSKLGEICHEKSEHIASNWQDREMALLWERAGNQLAGFYAEFSDRYSL